MADHLDVPGLVDVEGHLIGPPAGDVRIDITDVYAFHPPGFGLASTLDGTKTVLVMNVNPLAPAFASSFRDDALYELKVDTDGDAIANIAFRIKFSPVSGGSQTATVRRAVGSAAIGRDNIGEVIISDAPVTPLDPVAADNVTTSGDFMFFAGIRSDPFFFDLLGFFATPPFSFTGSDFFADKKVFGIVLEMPNIKLGTTPTTTGVWARCLIPENGDMLQVDRMGRPAINTVFNKGQNKVKFNRAEPRTDLSRFTDDFVKVLTSFSYSTAAATTIVTTSIVPGFPVGLLPDTLKYDYMSLDGFLNGRKLDDDVIDIELGLVSKGLVTTDMVGTHTNLLSSFPYLGNP